MARAHLFHVIRDQAGNAIDGALVTLYETGTTTAVGDAYDALTGGSLVTQLTSNSRGVVECWFDDARTVDLLIQSVVGQTINAVSGAAASFTDYTRTVSLNAADDVEQSVFDVREFGAVGDGTTDDTAAIQAAIDAAEASTAGGRVVIPPAVHVVSSTLIVDGAAVLLSGAGRGYHGVSAGTPLGSVLKLANNANVDLLEFRDSTGDRQTPSGMEWITVHGNRGNNSSGSGVVVAGTRQVWITNCTVTRCAEHGIEAKQGSGGENTADCRIENCETSRNGADGIRWVGSDSDIVGGTSHSNVAAGITLSSGSCSIIGTTIWSNDVGISLSAADKTRIVGARCDANERFGLNVNDADDVNVTGSSFWNNGQDSGVGNNQRVGLRVVGTSTGTMLSGIVASDDQGSPTQKYGLYIEAGAGASYIAGFTGQGNGLALYNLAGGHAATWLGSSEDTLPLDLGAAPFTAGDVNVDGDLNHDGSNVGFFGSTPVAQQADAGTAVGTDATVINNIVTALQNLGLMA